MTNVGEHEVGHCRILDLSTDVIVYQLSLFLDVKTANTFSRVCSSFRILRFRIIQQVENLRKKPSKSSKIDERRKKFQEKRKEWQRKRDQLSHSEKKKLDQAFTNTISDCSNAIYDDEDVSHICSELKNIYDRGGSGIDVPVPYYDTGKGTFAKIIYELVLDNNHCYSVKTIRNSFLSIIKIQLAANVSLDCGADMLSGHGKVEDFFADRFGSNLLMLAKEDLFEVFLEILRCLRDAGMKTISRSQNLSLFLAHVCLKPERQSVSRIVFSFMEFLIENGCNPLEVVSNPHRFPRDDELCSPHPYSNAFIECLKTQSTIKLVPKILNPFDESKEVEIIQALSLLLNGHLHLLVYLRERSERIRENYVGGYEPFSEERKETARRKSREMIKRIFSVTHIRKKFFTSLPEEHFLFFFALVKEGGEESEDLLSFFLEDTYVMSIVRYLKHPHYSNDENGKFVRDLMKIRLKKK